MRHLIICLMGVALFSFFISCQKEVSVEYGSPAKGSLQSSAGDCLPKSVAGSYVANKALNDSNFIEVTVNVTSPGPYTIFTDSLNGYTFKGSGTFASTGSNTVRLKGNGKPTNAGVNNFTVVFDSSFCNIAVTVLPAGSSGVAAFSMVCTSFAPAGTYYKDTTLTGANTVSLQVNVASPGTYTITTNTVNGYSFSTSGTFGGTGIQTVTLQGSGKPIATGVNNFIATGGTLTCNFSITVTTPTPGCTTPSVQGTYTAGTIATASNKVVYTHNYAAAGSYTVSTNTVNGYSFGPSTISATAGSNTITLTATGTPATAGTNTFTINFNDGTTCTFTVTVVPVVNNDYFPTTANSYWTYNYDTGPADTFKVTNAGPTQVYGGNTYQRFVYSNGASGEDFYRKTATGFYYRSDDTAGYGAQGFTFPSNSRLDVLFLKNALSTGDSLISDFPCVADTGMGTITGTLRYKFKVINASATITVNGKTFTNVYQLRAFYEFGLIGIFFDITSSPTDYYYAKGVGLIRLMDSETPPNFEDIRYWQVN